MARERKPSSSLKASKRSKKTEEAVLMESPQRSTPLRKSTRSVEKNEKTSVDEGGSPHMARERKPSSSLKTSKRSKETEEAVLMESPQRLTPLRKSARSLEKNEKTSVDEGGSPHTERKRKASSSSEKSKRLKETVQAEEAVLMESPQRSTPSKTSKIEENEKISVDEDENRFIGEPVPEEEARQRWPHRYAGKKGKGIDGCKSLKGKDESDEIIQAKLHFTQAEIDGRIIFNLEDDAHVKAGEGEDNYICRILEMFEALDGSFHFTAQWFYRAKDTIIKNHYNLVDDKRVFLSEVKDDNPLNCLVERLKICRLPLNMGFASKKSAILDCDYYYDLMYLLPNFSFVNLPSDNIGAGSESGSTISSEANAAGAVGGVKFDCEEVSQVIEKINSEMTLLDLYSGCGAMSTGLCLGANLSGVNLVTKWAVDLNKYACESLKLNHPETQVRNESAGDFLNLLKEWERLCISFSLIGSRASREDVDIKRVADIDSDEGEGVEVSDGEEDDSEDFEVEKVLAICHGDPKEIKKPGLYLKIRWKGYGPDEDSWEPMEGLGNCEEKIKEFVTKGFKSKILPLPGNVDVICGGPPCQGISGFNRFRNKENPLDDPKNKQLVVFMDIVNFLRPRFVLMENVVDIVRFAGGYLGRYALGRLVGMNYQARVGMMAAGCFGLPQFRMRIFIWGAGPKERLPQYPLPTHNLVVRGTIPVEFESCTVAYEEGCNVELEKELLLQDAISDLPPVENDEARDDMPYEGEPETEFQRFIRLRKDEVGCSTFGEEVPKYVLFDHRPLQLNEDDYQRVCQIPMRKGANFRDLTGVMVGKDNIVELDPNCARVYLSSGKPLVPDYALTFVGGTSTKPFGRLWWDETVPTVVTRAEPHNQTILHPQQNRVLTIRENARLQGFPDYYRLFGPIKERYIQVGNAVAVPVARALGYALALAFQGSSCGEEPLFTLPKKFPNIMEQLSLEDDY